MRKLNYKLKILVIILIVFINTSLFTNFIKIQPQFGIEQNEDNKSY